MNTKKFIRLSINYSAFCIFFFIFAPESRSRKQNCLAHKKKQTELTQTERKKETLLRILVGAFFGHFKEIQEKFISYVGS